MTHEIAGIIVGLLGFIFFISGGVLVYYVFYYLWKFEKTYDVKIEGRGLYLDRAICVGLLSYMAVLGNNKRFKNFLKHSSSAYLQPYEKIPHECMKPFKIAFLAMWIELISMILVILIEKIFLDK